MLFTNRSLLQNHCLHVQSLFTVKTLFSVEYTIFTLSDRHTGANSVDPDQTPQNESAVSDQGLHVHFNYRKLRIK